MALVIYFWFHESTLNMNAKLLELLDGRSFVHYFFVMTAANSKKKEKSSMKMESIIYSEWSWCFQMDIQFAIINLVVKSAKFSRLTLLLFWKLCWNFHFFFIKDFI